MVQGGGASKLKKAAKKILAKTCGSFSWSRQQSTFNATTESFGSPDDFPSSGKPLCTSRNKKFSDVVAQADSSHNSSASKNLCAICLDPLNYSSGSSTYQAIFTAQCSHAFHLACISSNVRHGSVTCPICRAHWTRLPRNSKSCCSLHCNQSDPILQILDDSIASFRVHRRSFLRSALYDDDDPVDADCTSLHLRLHISLLPVHLTHPNIHFFPESVAEHLPTVGHKPFLCASSSRAYLCVRLAHQPAIDLILVASPNGPHLRLMKQAMALVIFSLRSVDRLAIVSYSSAATRMFPLKRMTSYGKRTALQVIDRLFYMGHADPVEGLKKGVKVLVDRVYRNPESCILHLSDSPTRSYHHYNMEVPITIHSFHVGFGFGSSNGFVMHEFEEFLARVLGGEIREIQLKVNDGTRIIKLGQLRGGEERKIPLTLPKSSHVCVEYSYIDSGNGECTKTGEIVIGIPDQSESNDGLETVASIGGRTSSVESWDYHDTFMARRWAKHLHGYKPWYPENEMHS